MASRLSEIRRPWRQTMRGNLLVTDTGNHRIVKLDGDGRRLWAVGAEDSASSPRRGTAQSEFDSPQALAVDSRNCRIQKFSPEGDLLTLFGSWGNAPGQFGGDGPLGIAVDERGRVLVSDSHTADGGNHRVQLFTPGGDYLEHFGSYGTGPRQFGGAAPIRQYGFDHGPGIGPVVRVGPQHRFLWILSKDGDLLATITADDAEGLFDHAGGRHHAVAVSRTDEGLVFIQAGHQILKFRVHW